MWSLKFVWFRWKDPANFYRTNWDVHFVPTLVRYQRVDGEVKETGRMMEDGILDEKKLYEFIGKVHEE